MGVAGTFWTSPHILGITLIIGCLLFFAGAGQYGLVKDEKGRMIFGQPPDAWVRLVHTHARLWRSATISMICGALVSVAGLIGLTTALDDAGDRGLAQIGLLAFSVGAVLMVILLAFRLTVDPWAGERLAKTNAIPEVYEPLRLWLGVFFVIYTILSFSGLVMYGGAVVSTGLLPQWAGWVAIVYGLAGLGLFAITRDTPPFAHYVVPLMIGILLLL